MKRSISLALIAAFAATLTFAHPAQAASVPAISAFDSMFSGVKDYTYQLHAVERLGGQTQTRTYQYSFMKPHFAKTLIISGDGNGSGGVWAGGDQVSGHQGGFLSGIHLKVGLHDSRAVSLRGYTIPQGLLQNIVAEFTTIPGKLTQRPSGMIAGQSTDLVELDVTNPASDGGVTKRQIFVSKSTHWPLREILYAGSSVVLDQTMTDIKKNVGLTSNDFPF